MFEPVVKVDNPLTYYPNRDWERFYRDIYRSESTLTFLCAPNDTHNCLLTAHIEGAHGRTTPLPRHRVAQREGRRSLKKYGRAPWPRHSVVLSSNKTP